jgi:DNA-binding HxlR family transcriptional regulator
VTAPHLDSASLVAQLRRRGSAGLAQDCRPAAEILARIGDKWSVLVVMLLGDGPCRFNEMKRLIGGISQRMLTLTLRGLERDGLVTRTVRAAVPPHVDYALTSLGDSLRQPIAALGQWAYANHHAIAAARARFDRHLKES